MPALTVEFRRLIYDSVVPMAEVKQSDTWKRRELTNINKDIFFLDNDTDVRPLEFLIAQLRLPVIR